MEKGKWLVRGYNDGLLKDVGVRVKQKQKNKQENIKGVERDKHFTRIEWKNTCQK